MKNKYSERIDRLRALMREKKLDAFYINGLANVSYFMGRNGADCSLYITQEDAFIITDFRYQEMAESLEHLTLHVSNGLSTLLDFMSGRKEKHIGLELSQLPLNFYLEFQKRLYRKKLEPVHGLIESLRIVKDEDEIEATRKAADIACKAFDRICGYLRPGITEADAAAELEYYMKKLGSEDVSFRTILISGIKTSMPHGEPSDKIIEKGDYVTMDFGAVVDGYHSDMTRTVAIGSATQEMKDVYQIVLDAQLACCEKLHAGLSEKEGDAIARDIISAAGYGEYFGHSLGHGTGLEIHEAPWVSPMHKDIIPENSISSIEPGIYLPGKFGVRIEDLAINKSDGIINFVCSPKELLIL